jgi:hypothetical protein
MAISGQQPPYYITYDDRRESARSGHCRGLAMHFLVRDEKKLRIDPKISGIGSPRTPQSKAIDHEIEHGVVGLTAGRAITG